MFHEKPLSAASGMVRREKYHGKAYQYGYTVPKTGAAGFGSGTCGPVGATRRRRASGVDAVR